MSRRRWLPVSISTVVAVGLYAAIQLRVVLTAAPGPMQALRTAFRHDQLGYLSIVADVASGNLQSHEPVTETGVNHYPRAYYTLIGLISRGFELTPVSAWNIGSAVLQLAAVAVLSVTMSRLSRRWWVGMLAPLPFFTGTLATLQSGSWYTHLDEHAVLWGPFGAMFPNNGETAGLSVITMVLCALAWVWTRPARRPSRVVVSLVSAAALGALSAVQTYSYLTGMYIIAAIVAIYFLQGARVWWFVATLGAVGIVWVAGPAIADRVGQLPMLMFGLLPTVPGLILGVKASRGWLALYAAVAAVAAAPQIVWTVSGLVTGDPFLTYRVASNVDLGVAHPPTIIASLPVVLPLVLVLGVAWRWRNRIGIAALLGTGATAALLSMNDLWGANAEPYRFWIEMFFLGGVVTTLAACHLGGLPSAARHRVATAGGKILLRTTAVACAVVYAVSLLDLWGFIHDPKMNATWNPHSSRDTALADAARTAARNSDSLVLTDRCIDPRTVKVTSAAPIAYFYLGMAWPERVDAVAEIMSQRDQGKVSASTLAASDTGWLLSDSHCSTALTFSAVDKEAFAVYPYSDPHGSGTITVWRLSP
ncbi:hypothetical protein [Microbacterium deminutum]|uniref:Glycosyltransferase RgtA/B/C/D-like domain-containing protein n=1 Tax=Microbacterium deminutum TaxID=344164 RepID=A0ABP5BKB2_9MICO